MKRVRKRLLQTQRIFSLFSVTNRLLASNRCLLCRARGSELDPKWLRYTLVHVNRCHFSKLLATGGGTAGLWQARLQAADPQADALREAAGDRVAGRTDRREPVNVADFQAWAKAALPPATYDYITTGSADEITLRENVLAFQRLRLLPPLLTGVAEAETTTTVLKERIALPILLAPVVGQRCFTLRVCWRPHGLPLRRRRSWE